MASISNDPHGLRRILFVDAHSIRRTIRLGKVSKRTAEMVRVRIESLLAAKLMGTPIDRDTASWLAEEGKYLRPKLERACLIAPAEQPTKGQMLNEFLRRFMERNGPSKKPATRVVWQQVMDMLNKYMPDQILVSEVTTGHAKQFVQCLKDAGLASTTIHKRVGFARQFFRDALDWQMIDANPFAVVKTQGSSVKSNVEVPRDVIDKVMEKCDTDWQAIVALSRYGGLRCPSEVLSLRWDDIDWTSGRMKVYEPKVEHHEGRGVRMVPLFSELAPYLRQSQLAAPEDATYVIAKQAYRDAAIRPGGWANANLRTQLLKRLDQAGVTPWPRLFHSMRATRQTELENLFPRHVVCAWMGNSSVVAERNYLLVTEGDFKKAVRLPEAEAQNAAHVDDKSGADLAQHTSAMVSRIMKETLVNYGENVVSPANYKGLSMEDNGLEPMTSTMPL